MSTKKPIKKASDIYASTEQEYDTIDYRRKLCDHWIAYQQIQPASVHEQTDIESVVMDNASNGRRRPTKRQHSARESDENQAAKTKNRCDRKDSFDGDIFEIKGTNDDDAGDFADTFFNEDLFDCEIQNDASKPVARSTNVKQSETRPKSRPSKTHTKSQLAKFSQAQKLPVENRRPVVSLDDFDDVWTSPRPNFRTSPVNILPPRPYTKKDSNNYAARTVGFDAKFDCCITPKINNTNNFDVNFSADFQFAHGSLTKQNEGGKSFEQFERREMEREHALRFDKNVSRNQLKSSDDDLFQIVQSEWKLNNDDALFKKPIQKYAIDKFDWNNNQGAKKTHRSGQRKLFNPMDDLKTPFNNVNSGFHVLKTMSTPSTVQPIINIKCNNLLLLTQSDLKKQLQ